MRACRSECLADGVPGETRENASPAIDPVSVVWLVYGEMLPTHVGPGNCSVQVDAPGKVAKNGTFGRCEFRGACSPVKNNGHRPEFQSLLIADQVYQDAESRKFIICGVFSELLIRQRIIQTKEDEPTPTSDSETKYVEATAGDIRDSGTPYAYIRLSEIYGPIELVLRYINLETHKVPWMVNVDFNPPVVNPITSYQFSLPLPRLPLMVGSFALELLFDDELLGQCRVNHLPYNQK